MQQIPSSFRMPVAWMFRCRMFRCRLLMDDVVGRVSPSRSVALCAWAALVKALGFALLFYNALDDGRSAIVCTYVTSHG